MGNNILESGSITLIGCFTAAQQIGGDKYIQMFADLTKRNIYGNQVESYLGSSLSSDFFIGGPWDGHESAYQEMATSNARKWSKATPKGKSIEQVGNLKIRNDGSFVTMINGGSSIHTGKVDKPKPKGRSKPKNKMISSP